MGKLLHLSYINSSLRARTAILLETATSHHRFVWKVAAAMSPPAMV
jgi:hypothetical protein